MTANENERSTSHNSIPRSNGVENEVRDDPRLIRLAQYVHSQDSGVTANNIAQQFAISSNEAEQRLDQLVENGFALQVGDDETEIGLTVRGKRLAKRGMHE
jgi:predicted HTH transcriptional regulator